MDQGKDSTLVGKADDYRLCEICGRNYPIREIGGRCQYTQCGSWVCLSCGLKCEECNKIYCANHARKLEERELKDGDKRNKIACHHCVPLRKMFCFIATAAYGTPFAKEIDILRFWRDQSLSTNLFGRIFISFYYLVSPPIANFITNKPTLRKIIRACLTRYVKFLRRIYKPKVKYQS